MKGTMSELELSLFRQRSHEALKQKARRGALFLGVGAGYVRIGHDRIEKDPDQRVQDALRLVFTKFTELQSVRQVHVWLRDEGNQERWLSNHAWSVCISSAYACLRNRLSRRGHHCREMAGSCGNWRPRPVGGHSPF